MHLRIIFKIFKLIINRKFTIFLFSTCTTLFSQNSSNVVDLKHPNFERLDWLAFKSVNDLRKDLRLPNLVWDNILHKAAKDHANYLISKNKLSHSQPNKERKTPADRVDLYNSEKYLVVGENLLELSLGVQIPFEYRIENTITYEASAKTIVLLWKSSYGHYKNIISEKYNCAAIATSYDIIKQRLVVVQVFGFANSFLTESKQPDYSQYLITFPKSKLPFGLRSYKEKEKNKKAIKGFVNLGFEQGCITGKYKDAKKIFRGEKSGITQEYIAISDFNSNDTNFSMVPNRRNGMYELNGKLTKPVYRRELLKYSRKNTERKYIIDTRFIKIKERTKDFIYPLKPNSSKYEYNVFLIKHKRLETFKTYMMIPGALFSVPFPNLEYAASFFEIDTISQYKTHSIYDTIEIKVLYSVNETDIDETEQKRIKNELSKIQGKIIEIQASAYASIEGKLESNQKLAENRMAYFINIVKPLINTKEYETQINTGEQWKMFFKQIEENELVRLNNLSKEEIRAYINENKSDTLLISLLDEQRYMKFRLICRQDFKELIVTNKTPTEIYDSILNIINSIDKPKASLIKSAEKAQLAYYNYLSRKDSVIIYNTLPFPILKKSPQFEYHDLVFRYLILKNVSDIEFLIGLHNIGYSRYFPSRLKNELMYNNLLLICNNYFIKGIDILEEDVTCNRLRQKVFYFKNLKNIDCRSYLPSLAHSMLIEIPKFIKIQRKVNQKKYTDDLYRYYYLNMIELLYGSVPMKTEINKYLKEFRRYFHPSGQVLTEKERLKYAYFYCAVMKYYNAKKLIEPIVLREVPNLEALKLYITLKLEDFEEQNLYIDYLISQFSMLGKEEWCDIWQNPNYLNSLLLENLKLKNFYNCNCDK